MFEIEKAYHSSIARIKQTVGRWRGRIASPLLPPSSLSRLPFGLSPASGVRTVGRFSEQVDRLLDDTRASFLAATSGSVMVKERTSRLAQLLGVVAVEARGVFQEQVELLRGDALRRMKRELVRLGSMDDAPPSSPDSAGTQTEIRSLSASRLAAQEAARSRILTSFRTLTDALAVSSLGLRVDEKVEKELQDELCKICDEFESSGVGKAVAMASLEREVQRGGNPGEAVGATPKRRGIGVALTIVGLLRPPGWGNFQGIINYDASSMLGRFLPLKIVLGVQNDADAPEVLADDRDQPLLRIQPRIHVDVDL